MFRALYTAASGMSAQQVNLDTIANNLANASTAGFRRRRVQFQDLLYQQLVVPGSAASQQTTVSSGLQVGLGTRSASTETLQNQGDIINTGNPLDLVIEGQGFFQVRRPTGEIAYTRSGEFHLDQTRNIVTANGDPLEPSITIPADATNISIGSDGTVSVTEPGQQQATQVGSIQLALFPKPRRFDQRRREPLQPHAFIRPAGSGNSWRSRRPWYASTGNARTVQRQCSG